ncbi:MAG: hypothetical protein D8M58_04115 [Calditrichaeota bacterium]|nr:MAG: hypothetical protein DWQ03_02960 [Calditrichota bacterium]MBL1204554.1 hypothetical protein [Calditrichota bacterium]NOG44382.1 hypothetical protein [Calditrichota bacterium]
MKKVNFGLLFLFTFTLNVYSQIQGTLIFENGKTQEFQDIEYISIYINDGNKYYSATKKGIPVHYNNSIREVPYNKLELFEVNTFQLYETRVLGGRYVKKLRGTVNIKTSTSISTLTKYELKSITILLVDELTGEIKKQTVEFLLNNRLNIRKIKFKDTSNSSQINHLNNNTNFGCNDAASCWKYGYTIYEQALDEYKYKRKMNASLKKEFRIASVYMEKAISLDPSKYSYYLLLSNVYRMTKDKENGIMIVKKGLKYWPNDESLKMALNYLSKL